MEKLARLRFESKKYIINQMSYKVYNRKYGKIK